MSVLTVRGLSDETRHALRVRARKHGRSMEAEVRRILSEAVQPTKQPSLSEDMAEFWNKYADLGDFEIPAHRMDDAIRPVRFDE